MRAMVASVASASVISLRNALYLSRKFCASADSEEAPLSFAIMFQVAKSARALVSARRASILSVALITLPQIPLPKARLVRRANTLPINPCLQVAGQQQNRADYKAGDRANNG